MVNKSKRAFKTISEAADDLGVQQHVLRFWESKFSQIKPMKRGGNRRFYRPDDIALLKAIKHSLYDGGLSIKDTQGAIKEDGVKSYVQAWKDETGYIEPAAAPAKKKPPPLAPSRPIVAPPEPAMPEPAPEPAVEVVEEMPAPEPAPVPEQPGLQFEAAAAPETAGDDDSIKISKDLVRALVDDLKALRALIDRIPD
ncbi:MAG: MerR family transcriptional regulator [Sphingomonadales bacterium]